ncbi:kinase-like domain-containing protein [Lentinula aff. detonsa]|uniref:Kinase-like domain-containing protein n=1 Tax=Lentinula aff. detonsa TaxID=2804958 RepID=A0AA38KR02_9AGAR|nr:kinase-like domain-containing protein [Lentinula aff. detonsa]
MSFFTDPVYSWPSDLCDKLLESRSLSASHTSYVDLYDEKFVLKTRMKSSGELDKDKLAREIDMISLAGPECSVPIIGRHFLHGAVNGFVTPYRTCLTQGRGDDIRPEVFNDRKEIIQKLTVLLENLHSKGIIHGDVKPSNLVLDDSGNLRIIDFAESVLESEHALSLPRTALTARYVSPSSMRALSPLTRADDLYATGVTIWHIYTGRLPFEDVDEDEVDDAILHGLRPDLTMIDNEDVRAIVSKYLQDGEPNVKPPSST